MACSACIFLVSERLKVLLQEMYDCHLGFSIESSQEGWGEKEISTKGGPKGVVDRQEEIGEEKEKFLPFLTHHLPAHLYQDQT